MMLKPGALSRRTITWLMIILFSAVGFLIYSNVLLHGVFLFDDFEYVVGNSLIEDFSSFDLSDSRQIGYLSFAVNFALGGDEPRGYHLVNVLIHIVNSLMVFFLVSMLFDLLSAPAHAESPLHRGMALLAAVLFLVHPVQTQAVSYITQRFTSLATLFYLLSALCYLKARRLFEARRETRAGYALYGLSFLSALLGMRTKEITFTIPFLFMLFELMVFARSSFGRRRFLYLLPHLALLLIIPLSLMGPEWGLIDRGAGIAEVTRREKLYDLLQRPFFEYLFTQFRVIVIYMRLLLLPAGQRVVYDLSVSRSLFDPFVLPSLALILLLIGGALYLARRSFSMTAPEKAVETRMISFGILWFFLTLSVESSVIPIKDLIFEHRVYLPSVGFLAAGAVLLVRAGSALMKRMPFREAVSAGVLMAAVTLPLSIGTYVRNEVWTDELKFWDDVVQKVPDKPIGYHNRGNAYGKIGQYEKALMDINKTISYFFRTQSEHLAYEDADLTPVNMAKTYMNRGTIYLNLGLLDKAREDFDRARRMMTEAPLDIKQRLSMADRYAKKGAYRHAVEEYNKILEWDPENAEALNDRANAFSWMGNYTDAIRDLSRVILLHPDSALAYHNRAIAYAWSGSRDSAVADFTRACAMGFGPACESIDIARRGGK